MYLGGTFETLSDDNKFDEVIADDVIPTCVGHRYALNERTKNGKIDESKENLYLFQIRHTQKTVKQNSFNNPIGNWVKNQNNEINKKNAVQAQFYWEKSNFNNFDLNGLKR